MLPGESKRRPGPQRAARLLPKGIAQTRSLLHWSSAAARPVLVCVQEHTRVGSANSQDIQLCGMAIQAQHCIIDVTEGNGVLLSPLHHARCVQSSKISKEKRSPQGSPKLGWKFDRVFLRYSSCRTHVNGTAVTSPVQLHHGDRILWGNNHFFRSVLLELVILFVCICLRL